MSDIVSAYLATGKPTSNPYSVEARNLEEIHTLDGHRNVYKVIDSVFPNGQSETTVLAAEVWSEPGKDFDNPLYVTDDTPESFKGARRSSGELSEADAARSLRRRRKAVRQACKSAGFDRMLTFTVRKDCMSRDAFGKAVVKTLKLASDSLGKKLHYVLTLELQKRGVWHAHVALRGRQDWKLLISIWRFRVLPSYGTDGAIFDNVRRHKKGKITPSQIAKYISKYIGKELDETEFNKKGYWISKWIPAPEIFIRYFSTKWEALKYVSEVVASRGNIFEAARAWQHADLDIFWYSTT